MDAVQVVCPSGLFPLPARCNIHGPSLSAVGPVHSSSHAQAAAADNQHQLLEQLQGFCDDAHKLLALLSVQRAQGAACYDTELQELMADASACIQQALQQAAAAKQPLLLTSSQHTSCFCRLLEQLHLLDVLRASVAAEDQAQQQLAKQPQQQDEQREWYKLPCLPSQLGGSFLSRCEQQLQAMPGIDAVLAALVMFCQQNQAAASKLTAHLAGVSTGSTSSAGSGGKPEAIDVRCLSSIQEQHTAARALPLLLRLYFNNNSRAETLAAGKPELLTAKNLERCLALLAAKPVVPGYADMHVSLTSELETCQPLQELLAARKLKLLPAAPWQLDGKSAAKLNQSYSLQPKVVPLLQQHDELCDLLSQVALEVKQAVAVDRDIEAKAFGDAERLVDGSINFVHAAKNTLFELDAWRLAQGGAGKLWKRQQQQQQDADDTAASCDRFMLQDEDVCPFMTVLGATKGLTGLLTDSSSWLEQLLQVQTIKQLREFAASTLPALAKQYQRNKRVQSLLKFIYASMQGQIVELKDDTYAPSYATSTAGDAPAAVLTPTGADGQQRQQSLRRQSGPVAEGFEGLKGRFGGKRAQAAASQQQQPDGASEDAELEALAALAGAEQKVMAAAAAVAAAMNDGAATAAARHPGSSHSEQQGEPAAHLVSEGEASSSAAAAAEAGVGTDEGDEQQGSAAALAAFAAATAAAAQPAKGKKKKFGKGLMKSIVSGKGKSKPDPSPEPELCSAPAALAAHAALEALLSEAEVEVAASEAEAAAAAAAAAKAMQDGSGNGSGRSSHSSVAGPAGSREQQGSGRLTLQLGLRGLHVQVGDDESALSKAGDEGIDTSGFSSMCSLSTAFQQPPDLPWEVSPRNGSSAAAAAAAASGPLDGAGAGNYSPRSVAVAAAQFESRIAQQTSRRSSRLSSNQVVVGVATTPPRVSLPASPRLLAEEELELPDGADFELAEVSDGGALETLDPVACSPRSARRFHFFKFRSILQHHEKLSTQALAEAAAAAAVLEAAAAKDGDGDAAVSGTSGRIRAVLSMRRRTTAASAVSKAAAVVDGEAAADAEEEAARASGEASDAAAAEAGASAAAMPGVSPRGSQSGDAYDTADVPASTHGAADVPDQPSKQGRIGGLMSRAASRMMNLSSRASREPGAAASSAAGAGSSQQARQGFKGLNFTAKLKKAMVDRRGTAEVAIDGSLLPTLQLDSVPPLACLLQLRVLLEQLMHEIKTETKKHLMMQLQMAAAAAAGGGSAKPDASIARPLRQVKAMIKAVHRMQLALDYQRQLAAAGDMSGLWLSRAYSSFFTADQQQAQQLRSPSAAGLAAVMAAEQQQQQEGVEGTRLYNLLFDDEQSEGSRSGSQNSAAQQRANTTQSRTASPFTDASCQDAAAGAEVPVSRTAGLASYPAALLAGCMRQLHRLPAELPLLALHLFWDARDLLQRCGLLSKGLQLLWQQEEACMCCYVQHLVPAAYEHFKRVAAHQTVTHELLSSCGARSLQPVQPLYFDALLREPCPVVLQGDYTAVARAAEGQLAQPGSLPGSMLLQGQSCKPAGDAFANVAGQQQLLAKQVINELQQALQALQQEQEAVEQQLLLEQQQQLGDDQQLSRGPSPGPAYGGKSLPVSQAASSEKLSAAAGAAAQQQKGRQGHRSKRRAAAAQAAADYAAAPAAVAGQTPLMEHLDHLKLAKQLMQAQQQQAAQALVEAESCSVLDVRQWLLAGLLASLKKDAAAVVACSRASSPSAVVEVQVQAAILQRTHQLLSQYAPLPCSWPQLWEKADAADAADSSSGCESACARAVANEVLAMLDTAVYDSEALVLLPAVADALAAAAGLPAPAGVLGEVSAALRPFGSFFGRQHLQAMLGLTGHAGQAHLLEGLMDKLDKEQGFLLDQLQVVQQQLPPALLQLPPAERCHSAGAVLQFYQQQLSSALRDPDGACSAALACLQRIGNCLALLHLLTMQQSVQATPAFMQVAPLLGIIGRPLTDAAAAAECFDYDGAPDPPTVQTAGGFASRSCAAGLLMPEVEQLLPSESARHAHEMQTCKELQQEQAWRQLAAQQGQPFDESLLKPGGELARHRMWQASHFQRLLLGPDAEKVRGPALLLTQTAELRAWRAAQAQECMGPCMERLRRWACVLQRQLQGLSGEACESEEEELQLTAGAAAGVNAKSDAAAAGQQQYLGGLAGRGLPEDLAVRASLAGEVPAGEVAGIGVRENTLYGSAITPPESPYKEQQQLAALNQQQDTADDSSAPAEDAAQQQQQAEEQEEAALAGGHSEQQQYHGSEASLSLAGSCITAKPDSQFSLSGAGSRPHISYDDREPMLTPPALQLDPLSANASASAVDGGSAAAGGITLKANTAAANSGALTSEELQVAAEAAAVAAASLPSSPRAGAAAAAVAAGVSIWEAAGAAAAQLPAGSVAPAQAKLAYKALLDSNAQHDGGMTSAAAGAEQGGRTYGLAELVGEVSDALSSARSDAGTASGSQRDLSSRQVLLHVAEEQQDPGDTAASYAGQVKQQAAAAEAGSGRNSPIRSPRGMQRSSWPGAPEDAAGSEDDTASESDVEQEGWKSNRQRPASRLRHRSSGGAPSNAVVAAAAAATITSSSDTAEGEAAAAAPASSTNMSPSRAMVPKLGLEALSPAKPTQADDAAAAAISSRSGPASSCAIEGAAGSSVAGGSRTASSRAFQTSRSKSRAAPSCPTSNRQCAEEAQQQQQQQPQQGGESDGEEASKTGRESVVDGSYPAPNVNDLLFESTCCELVRVKDENNVLRSELEMMRNQLQNRDTSLALLSGNLFTPRPSEGGGSVQRPATVPEEALPSLTGERPARSRAVTPRTMQASSEAAAAQAPAATAGAASSSTATEQRIVSADGSADVTVSSGGGAVAAECTDTAAACAAAAASPGGRSAKAAKLQPHGLGLSAGLIKGPAGLGLSPEPSDLRIESSKISMRAQQPSPLPPAVSACDDDSGSSSDDSSSTAGDGSNEDPAGGISATRKLKLPVALRTARSGSSHAAQLAVAMSALKFALLLGVAKGQAGGDAAAAAGIGSSAATGQTSAATPQASPLKRLTRAASVTMNSAADAGSAAAAAAGEQPIKPGGIAAADVGSASAAAEGEGATAGSSSAQAAAAETLPAGAAAAERGRITAPLQHPSGSGRIAGGGYGDGPLLASAVLLQLTGQARKHALLDATSRIAHWVEYDAVKSSGTAGTDLTQEFGAAAGGVVAAGWGADGSGAAALQLPGGLQTPGGLSASAASSMALPKPRSKKWQEEEAEEEAQMRKQQAAEQLLLQRLAAAARQADRVAKDGTSLAERFAPPAHAHSQQVQVKVHRIDKAALLAQREASAAGASQPAGEPTAELGIGKGSRLSSMAGAGASAGYSQPGTPPAQEYAVLAVPVRQEVLEFGPHVRPWAGLTPSHWPIQGHPALPMQRPRPLLLPTAAGKAGRMPQPAAGAGAGGIVGPAGRLLPGVGVGANAGLVAAARAVHAREALLAAMPRTAVYSYSVMSDHNRSGRMDDGYSKAPSTADLENLGDISPCKGWRQTSAAAAARLGGMRAAGVADQSGGYSASEASSPSKSPTRSPTKRQQAVAHAGGLLASLVG